MPQELHHSKFLFNTSLVLPPDPHWVICMPTCLRGLMRGVGGSSKWPVHHAPDAGCLVPGVPQSSSARESCKVPQVIAKYCITLARVPELSWPRWLPMARPQHLSLSSSANQRPAVASVDQWEARSPLHLVRSWEDTRTLNLGLGRPLASNCSELSLEMWCLFLSILCGQAPLRALLSCPVHWAPCLYSVFTSHCPL